MIGNPTRPGDLAVIVIDTDGLGREGAFCRVLRVHPSNPDDRCVKFQQPILAFEIRRRANWIRKFLGDRASRVTVKQGVEVTTPDAWLKPIRPPAPEEKDERAEHLVGVV